MPLDPRVSVGAAAVLWRDGRLLMEQRAGAHGAGQWSIPGGWVDFGEDPVATAIREAKEETGLVVSEPLVRDVIHTTFPDDNLACTTWFVGFAVIEGEAQILEPTKSSALLWVPQAEVLDRPLFSPLDEFLRRHGG